RRDRAALPELGSYDRRVAHQLEVGVVAGLSLHRAVDGLQLADLRRDVGKGGNQGCEAHRLPYLSVLVRLELEPAEDGQSVDDRQERGGRDELALDQAEANDGGEDDPEGE